MLTTPASLRRAGRDDEAGLLEMQATAVRVLGRAHYATEALEAFIRHVGTMDVTLLDEGRFHLAEVGGVLAACGGWSTRRPRSDACEPGRARGAPAEPVIRSVFVNPMVVRMGLGQRIMEAIEAEIAASGFGAATLTCFPAAVSFYRMLGYEPAGRVCLDLPGDHSFAGLAMRKSLTAATRRRSGSKIKRPLAA
jgi:GNAT superfamily N-acetyltransferase